MPSTVSAALAALAFTRPAYETARAMYDGDVQEVIAAPRLAEVLAGTGTTYCVNYARTPVDVLVERTMIQGWTVKDATQLAGITSAWDDNELGLEAKDVHRLAYEYGDSYLIGWSDDDLPGRVSCYAHDPTGVRVFYDPSKPRKKSHAVQTWLEAGDRDPDSGNGLEGDDYWRRVNLYFPDHLERYVSRYAVQTFDGEPINSVGSTEDDNYRDFDDDGDDSILFYSDHGMPDIVPVFHFRTGRPYGRPEHADAYGPQRGINKLIVSMMGSVDFHILPQRYATTESALKGASGAPVDLFGDLDEQQAASEAEAAGFAAGSDMESGPGTVWLLSGGDVKVGEFSAALMSNFLEPKNDLVESMAAVTDLPLDRYRPAGGQAPSGESQRMAEIPLNKKTSDRFAQFGVTWREWAAWVLAVQGNGSLPENLDATVAWAPPETYSDEASWRTAALQLSAGVPYEQVLRERGYSDELVEQWAKDKATKDAAAAAALAAANAAKDAEPVAASSDVETEDVDV